MFIRLFIVTLMAALFGTGVGMAYNTVYAKILTMDFSEGASLSRLLVYNVMFCFGTALVYFAISKAVKKDNLASFLTNFIAAGASIALVFYQLTLPDPKFTNESVQGMESYYNTFFIPILFFPALSWMTFKTLLKKN
jgi:hypothetical protein